MVNPDTDRVLINGALGAIGSTFVHLAGIIGRYTLKDLFRVNARGLFDVVGSERLADVERIIFASSNHSFRCYPITDIVSLALPPRPDSLYGVFKVWHETTPRNYYDRHGIRSLSLHINTFRSLPIDQRQAATWLSSADVTHVVDVSLRHRDPGCMVVSGYSSNTRLKTHDRNWVTLGCQPPYIVGFSLFRTARSPVELRVVPPSRPPVNLTLAVSSFCSAG